MSAATLSCNLRGFHPDGTRMFKDATFRLDYSVTEQWKEPATTYQTEALGALTDKLGEGRKLRHPAGRARHR